MNSRKANFVAGVLATDSVLHLYWATGATWPATDQRALSEAVLGGQASFTPRVLLPLASLLAVAAILVVLRSRRGPEPLLQAGALIVGIGLMARALAGLVWATGVGVQSGGVFYWLNLLLYTPLCLVCGLMTLSIARSWRSRVAVGVPLALVACVLAAAYGYQPAEQRDYSPTAGSSLWTHRLPVSTRRFRPGRRAALPRHGLDFRLA